MSQPILSVPSAQANGAERCCCRELHLTLSVGLLNHRRSGFIAGAAIVFEPRHLVWPFYGMNASTRIAHVSLAEALTKGPPPSGNLAVPIFTRGSLTVELYTPVDHDPQTPHTRDEVYFVTRGSGIFFDGDQRHPVETGAFLFVAAGQPHRFEQFSSDFAVWVMFYGPERGEMVD